jgi:hypothetical protein
VNLSIIHHCKIPIFQILLKRPSAAHLPVPTARLSNQHQPNAMVLQNFTFGANPILFFRDLSTIHLSPQWHMRSRNAHLNITHGAKVVKHIIGKNSKENMDRIWGGGFRSSDFRFPNSIFQSSKYLSFKHSTWHPFYLLLLLQIKFSFCLIGRGGSVADRLMDPSSEATNAMLGIGVGEFPDPSPIIACTSTRTIISRRL